MHSLAVDANLETATAVAIKNDEISLSLANGRRVVAPVWLFPELEGMTSDDFSDVELIDGGRGILIGDKEAVTVLRVLGMDVSESSPDEKGTAFSLL